MQLCCARVEIVTYFCFILRVLLSSKFCSSAHIALCFYFLYIGNHLNFLITRLHATIEFWFYRYFSGHLLDSIGQHNMWYVLMWTLFIWMILFLPLPSFANWTSFFSTTHVEYYKCWIIPLFSYVSVNAKDMTICTVIFFIRALSSKDLSVLWSSPPMLHENSTFELDLFVVVIM
jgi:hypothetical protein